MTIVSVKELYPVDTISKNNVRAWNTLLKYVNDHPEVEEFLFDFKGIEVNQPWETLEFKLLMQNPRVYIKMFCSDLTVNSINMMCMLNGINGVRAFNEEPQVVKTLTAEEKKAIEVGRGLQGLFKVENEVHVLYLENRYTDLCGVNTVNGIHEALNIRAEMYGKPSMHIELGNITVYSHVIEHLTVLIKKMAEVGVNLSIHSNYPEIMQKVNIYRSIVSKNMSDMDKTRLVKSKLRKGRVGMLMKYKDTKRTDEFGRKGDGVPLSCRVAIYRGMAKEATGVVLEFATFNGNKFYTREHWAMENDNEILHKLEGEIVRIPISQFGMYSDFMGERYHFLAPIQNDPKQSMVMFSTSYNGSVVRTRMTIPERIKAVLDDWGIDYEQESLIYSIQKTKELLGNNA